MSNTLAYGFCAIQISHNYLLQNCSSKISKQIVIWGLGGTSKDALYVWFWLTHSCTLTVVAAAKMWNPVALFRSASSHSTLSRHFHASSSSRDDGYDSSSDISESSLVFSESHQSTLDRLYAWEKKLYKEVKVITFPTRKQWNNCMQFRA